MANRLILFVLLSQAYTIARPLVNVYNDKNELSGTHVALPAVFKAPIRPDIVNFVHVNMSKNNRQPYAVSKEAGTPTDSLRLSCYLKSPEVVSDSRMFADECELERVLSKFVQAPAR